MTFTQSRSSSRAASTGPENRKSRRQKLYTDVWIDPGLVAAPIPCKVTDISLHGARLVIPEGVVLPDSFLLCVGSTKKTAHVVWTRKTEIGVEFDETVK